MRRIIIAATLVLATTFAGVSSAIVRADDGDGAINPKPFACDQDGKKALPSPFCQAQPWPPFVSDL